MYVKCPECGEQAEYSEKNKFTVSFPDPPPLLTSDESSEPSLHAKRINVKIKKYLFITLCY